jgi:3-dehydroquinate dehydratase-2
MKVLILNGPNLNKIGIREPEIYGNELIENYINKLIIDFPDFEIVYYQSNHEGDIIDQIQNADLTFEGIVLNAGAYSHTSIAITDSLKLTSIPVVEVHISNIYAREDFRHQSLLSSNCQGVIVGFGLNSYKLALNSFIQ